MYYNIFKLYSSFNKHTFNKHTFYKHTFYNHTFSKHRIMRNLKRQLIQKAIMNLRKFD